MSSAESWWDEPGTHPVGEVAYSYRSEQRDHTRHVPPVAWDDSGRACLLAFALARHVLRLPWVASRSARRRYARL